MTHDPLCATVLNTEMNEAFCNCALISRVREDEREWSRKAAEQEYADRYGEGYVAALCDAVEAINAIPYPYTFRDFKRNAIAAIEALDKPSNI